jgi:2-iminoacetate synthase ThiH
MDSMPGGGAEIFDPEVREQICEHKCDASGWFETHREMHRMGYRTNCTMLIGHIEEPRHRVDHLTHRRPPHLAPPPFRNPAVQPNPGVGWVGCCRLH